MSKQAAPPLMTIFRSPTQAEVLTAVMLNPKLYSIQDLAARLGAPQSTVYREVTRLLDAGLIRDDRVGRTRVLRPNTDHPAFRPLRDLVMVAFGPREVVEEEFGELRGLDGLVIHGSWAARYSGEEGPEPGDIDVIAIGKVDRDEAFDAAARAQQRLGREVNVQVVSGQRWAEAQTPFLQEVKDRPLVVLKDPDLPASAVDEVLAAGGGR